MSVLNAERLLRLFGKKLLFATSSLLLLIIDKRPDWLVTEYLLWKEVENVNRTNHLENLIS